jgi:hypothetical protein
MVWTVGSKSIAVAAVGGVMVMGGFLPGAVGHPGESLSRDFSWIKH